MPTFFSSPRLMVCLLLVLSLALHLGWLDQPNEVVFDEVYNGGFVSGYLTGKYLFATHPPLGRLLMAGMARLASFPPTFSFREVGVPYPNHQFIWLRLLPALFGSLLVPLVYLLALRIAHSRLVAAMAGMFVLLDNALLVESKFMLLEPFLLVFGFLSLYLFWQSTLFWADGQWGGWAALGAAVAAGLCLATKWTGLGFWGLLLVFGGYGVISKIWRGEQGRRDALLAYVALLVLPPVLYAVIFFIHFKLLQQPGPGNQFMTPRFHASQATGYPLRDFPANMCEVHRKMYTLHAHAKREHLYGSRWYAWPLMRQAVYYWGAVYYWRKDLPTARGEMITRRIYLLGNPVVWWTSTGLTAAFLLGLFCRLVRRVGRWIFPLQGKQAVASAAQRICAADALLAVGYLANLLPFAGISRVTFLYHYLVSLIFSILIASVMLERIRRGKKAVCADLVVLTLAGFIGVVPVTFGISLHDWPLWGTKGEGGLLSLLLSR